MSRLQRSTRENEAGGKEDGRSREKLDKVTDLGFLEKNQVKSENQMAALQVGVKPFQQCGLNFLLTSRSKCGKCSLGRLENN